MTSAALLSSARLDWRTPEPFLDLVRAVGPIELDPATSPDNPTGARRYYAAPVRGTAAYAPGYLGACGLAGTWTRGPFDLAFTNPPYGAHLSGPVDPDAVIVRKGVVIGHGSGWGARIASDPGPWLALVPSRTDAEWWHALHRAANLCLFWRSPRLGSRIQFVDPTTGRPRKGSTLASSVFFRGDMAGCERFARVFAEHGRLIAGCAPVMYTTPAPSARFD